MMNEKCVFVSLVGEPNAGKSTLLNTIIGEKISIVSPKIQTTRTLIRGIAEFDESQIVFIDTPGFCLPHSSLEKILMRNLRQSYKESDIILIMIDASLKNFRRSYSFIERFKASDRLVAIVLNKIDLIPKEKLLQIAQQLSVYDFVHQVFMISAIKNDGVGSIIKFLKENSQPNSWLYNKGQKTDVQMSFRLAEITREKIYQMLNQELPYNIYIETESLKESEKKVKIYQSIVVNKDSQKGIVLGNSGSMIKLIKILAISDMIKILHKKVELKLFVKVKKRWTERKDQLLNANLIS